MKISIYVWAASLMLALCVCGMASAKSGAARQPNAQQELGKQDAGAQTQPKVIKTAYFNLLIAPGWRLLKPVQAQAGAVSVLLGAPGDKGAIAINVIKSKQGAAELVRNMRVNMEKDKVSLQKLEEKDGIQHFGFSRGKATGRAWIGANGKEAAAVTIFGDQEAGKAALKRLKPKDPAIFPRF